MKDLPSDFENKMTTGENAMTILATLESPPLVDESMMDIGGEEIIPNPNLIDIPAGTVDLSQLGLSALSFVNMPSLAEPCTEVVQSVESSLLLNQIFEPSTPYPQQEQIYGNSMFQMETEIGDETCERQGQASPVEHKQEKQADVKTSVTEELKTEVNEHLKAFPQKIPPVKVLRKIIPKMLMCSYDNLNQKKVKGLWTEKKPEDWPDNIPFKDPNNKVNGEQKPRREDLEAMYTYLKKKLGGMQQSGTNIKQAINSMQPQTPQFPVQVEDSGSGNEEQDDDVMPGKELGDRIRSKMEFVEANAGSLWKIFSDIGQRVLQLGEKGQENVQFLRHGHSLEYLLDMYRLDRSIPDSQDINNLFSELPLSVQTEDHFRPLAEVQGRQEISSTIQEYNLIIVEGTGDSKLRDEPTASPENFEEVRHPEMKVMLRKHAEQSKSIDAGHLDLLQQLGIQEHVFCGPSEDISPLTGKEVKVEGRKFHDCDMFKNRELEIDRVVNIDDLMELIKYEMPDIKEKGAKMMKDDQDSREETTSASQREQGELQVVAMSPGQVLSPRMADVTAQYDSMQIQSPISEIQIPTSPAKRKLDDFFNNSYTTDNQPQVPVAQNHSDPKIFFRTMAQRQDQQVFVFGESGTQEQIPRMVAMLSDDESDPQPCKKMRV